jgi:hypothetical protein
MLDLPELSALIGGYNRELFRLETLDWYRSKSDGRDVDRYLRGESAPDPGRKERWLAQLRRERADGRLRQRVHVLRSPIGPYLRYECEWGYLPNSAAGEDIRVLDLAERPRPADLDITHDFWLIDDRDVVRMHYDGSGRFAGAELLASAELPRYRAARDAALTAAEPFTSYWPRHPEYHQANQAA